MVVTILNQVMATDKPDYIYQTLAKSISDFHQLADELVTRGASTRGSDVFVSKVTGLCVRRFLGPL